LDETQLAAASASPSSPKKRKAANEGASTSAALPSITATQNAGPAEQEADGDDASEEETVDELYCSLKSNIVGVQYYNGKIPPSMFSVSICFDICYRIGWSRRAS